MSPNHRRLCVSSAHKANLLFSVRLNCCPLAGGCSIHTVPVEFTGSRMILYMWCRPILSIPTSTQISWKCGAIISRCCSSNNQLHGYSIGLETCWNFAHHLWRDWTTEGSMGLDQWYRRNIARPLLLLSSPCSTDVLIPITEEGHTTRLIPVSCCTTATTADGSSLNVSTSQLFLGLTTAAHLQYHHSLIPRPLAALLADVGIPRHDHKQYWRSFILWTWTLAVS